MRAHASELTGVNKLLAIGTALSNSNITRLMAHFILMGFIPNILKANATKVIYENSGRGFDQGTMVVIPCKPSGSKNENVTHAEIFFMNEPTITGAASEEIIEGKNWISAYCVNKTTSQVESVTVDLVIIGVCSIVLSNTQKYGRSAYSSAGAPSLSHHAFLLASFA